jgi:hypothetical protein
MYQCTDRRDGTRTKAGQIGEICTDVGRKAAVWRGGLLFTPRGSAVRARHRPPGFQPFFAMYAPGHDVRMYIQNTAAALASRM